MVLATKVVHPAHQVVRTDDQRVRVLWLINGLGAGGAERLLHSAARVSDHDRFAYEVAFTMPGKTALVHDLVVEGVPAHSLGGRHRIEAEWPRRLRGLLIDRRYDVLHLHSPLAGGVARAIVLTIPRANRPIVVSTEHNQWSSYRLATRLVNAALCHRDAARWAVSEDVRGSIWPLLRGGVEVLVHGLVLADATRDERVREEVRRELSIEEHEVLVGTVANYRGQKAYPDLLHAARKVLDHDPRVRFVAVGQGPLEREIRRLHSDLQLGDRLQHLGQRDDVTRLLNGFDIFALASHYEGFPVSVMEALAAGLPVVVTDVGGIHGTVSDGVHGRVVPAGRPDDFAAAVLAIAGDAQLRRRMGAAARDLGQQFDIRHAVRKVEQTYLELLIGSRLDLADGHVT